MRVWVVRVAQEGDYDVETSGNVTGAGAPRLAFGRNLWNDALALPLGVITMVSTVVALGTLTGIIALVKTMWADHRAQATPPSYVLTSDGVQAEQLKHLYAALRDSGALTEREYQAEKRGIDRS